VALALALLGVLLVMGSTTWYFLTINKEKVPRSVAPYGGVLVVGGLAGVASLVLDPGVATGALFTLSGGMGVGLLYLLSLRTLPDGALTAQVGRPMPAFEAIDGQGQPFDLQSMKGRRLMVKVFRGSW
jgi:hypothetical protein